MKKKIFKWLAITLMSLVCLFVLLVVLVRFIFPNEAVRQEVQALLAEQLGATVQIQSLQFDLLTGFEAGPVDIFQGRQRLAHLERLTLHYNLWHLLRGKLVVDEVVLDGAKVSVDLDNLPKGKSAAEPSPAPPSGPQELPLIPFAMDLRTLAVRNSEFQVRQGTDFSASLAGVNLESALGLVLGDASVTGHLTIDNAEVVTQGKTLRLPVDLQFTLSADLQEESLTIQAITLKTGPALRVSLSGQVDEFLTKKVITLEVKDVGVDLNHTLKVVKDFLPPDLQDIQLHGTVSPSVNVQGALLDSGFGGVVRLAVQADQVQGSFPAFQAILGPTSLNLQSSDIVVKDNLPQGIGVELSLSSQGATFQSYAVENMNLKVTAQHGPSGAFSTTLDLQGDLAVSDLPMVDSLTQPMKVEFNGSGNTQDLAVTINHALLKVGDLIKVVVRGKVSPVLPDGGMREVQFTAEVEPQLESVLTALPVEHRQGLGVKKEGDPDFVTVEVTGTVTPDFHPHRLDLVGSVNLSEITVSRNDPHAGGRLDYFNLSFQGDYAASKDRFNGVISAALGLSALKYGGMAQVGKTSLTFGSTVRGRMSPDFQLTRLTSQDTLKIDLVGLHYQQEGLRAKLKQLVLSSKTREDLLAGDYRVDHFRASSDSLFDLTFKGRYRTKGERFSFETAIPSLNIGNLLRSVSGATVGSLASIDPSGQISVQLKGAGRVPNTQALEIDTFPVALEAHLKLHDVKGAVQGYELIGANGTVDVVFEPEQNNYLKTTTNLRVDSVTLPPGLPLQQASGLFADVDLTVTEFNHIQIQNLHVGMEGADLSVNGSVAGLRPFVKGTATPVGKGLAPLFVKVRTHAGVDIGKIPNLLKPYGLEGSGRAGVDLAILKKEHGPLDVHVNLDTRQLHLTQEGARVVNLNGGVDLRKVLTWMPGQNGVRPQPPFSPTTLLPQLRTLSSSHKDLTIETLDVGGVAITNLSSGIQFDGTNLLIQNLVMSLLGGGAGGNIFVQSGEAFGVTTKLEAVQLDLNELVDPAQKISGDSKVDGIVNFTAVFEAESGRLDFAHTELDLFITKIGRNALDRILLFLDPDGANPSIVAGRAAVGLANPSTVRVTLRKGLLGLRINFQEGFLNSLDFNRIPIGKIRLLRDVTKTVPQWDMIRDTMKLIGAHSYGVDPEGQIVFR